MVDELKRLIGLTDYEARVYAALCRLGEGTAYRLAGESGVPQSRVYETAERLVDRGCAIGGEGRPRVYRPVPPEDAVAPARERFFRDLRTVERAMEAGASPAASEPGPWLTATGPILAACAGAAEAAAGMVRLVGADAAVTVIEAAVLDCVRPGGLQAQRAPSGAGDGAWFAFVADERVAVIGQLAPRPEALVSRRPGLIRVCLEAWAGRLYWPSPDLQGILVRSGSPSRAYEDWQKWEAEKQRRLLRAQ